jgi:hypothetical protein
MENVSIVFLSFCTHKFLWIFCICLHSSPFVLNSYATNRRRERKFLHKNFTFFALRRKINYYQISSLLRFHFQTNNNKKPGKKAKKFHYTREICVFRHSDTYWFVFVQASFSLPRNLRFSCLNKLFNIRTRGSYAFSLCVFAACFENLAFLVNKSLIYNFQL